jgi:hypothetical protein
LTLTVASLARNSTEIEPDGKTHPDEMQLKILRQQIARTVGFSREIVGWIMMTLNKQALVTAHGDRRQLSKRVRLIKKISGKGALTPDQGPAHA